MSYKRNGLIERRGYGGQVMMGGVLSTISDAAKNAGRGVLNFYNQSQQAQGAAAALAAQQQAAAAQRGGISTTTLVVGGAAVLGLVLLLRR